MARPLGESRSQDPPRTTDAPTHGATRRTFLATGTVAAGALAGGAMFPTSARAAGDPVDSILPAQWPDGPGRLNTPQRADATLRRILEDIDPERVRHTVETL